MKLRCIGETHPGRILESVFYSEAYIGVAEKAQPHFAQMYDAPDLLFSDSFWNRGVAILEQGKLRSEQCKDGVYLLTEAELKKLQEINMDKIEIARRIWTKTCEVIKSGTKEAYYFEGDSQYLPPINFAKNIGLELVSLDGNNKHYNALVRTINDQGHMGGILRNEYDELQIPREEEWVKRIIKPGLLVVGADHLRNTWGLVDRLKRRDVELEMVLNHESDIKSNDALERESGDIFSAAFERWQNSYNSKA